ncbi:MAG: acetyltransferase [Pseudomonadota bacterium]|nr:acetyltransferase [Pseudomonadota bacterium]
MLTLVLFGVRSPLVVDYQETCLRLGIEPAGRQASTRPSRALKGLAMLDEAEPGAGRAATCVAFVPRRRAELAAQAAAAGFTVAAPLIDPTSVVATSSEIEDGCYLNAGCVIGGASRIGAHVVINRAASIGHHVLVDDFASIGPGVTIPGSVTIGARALIGAGSVLLPGVSIGADAVISAGSVVRNDVAEGMVVSGNPARPLPRRLLNSLLDRDGDE